MHSLRVLFDLKFALARNSFRRLREKSPLEFITLIVFLLLAGGGLFVFFYYSFNFFKNQEPFGPILLNETFYLFNFALFIMLLISSGVSAYAALFQSKEVSFLAVRPVHWQEIFFTKLIETLWYSSWSILFVTIPFMVAYAFNKSVSPILFPIYCVAFYLPFVWLTAILGSLLATFTVWLLPSKKHRMVAIFLCFVGILYFLYRTQPELIKEQGSLSGIMMGYLPNVAIAKNGFLPSFWLSQGILSIASKGKGAVTHPQDGLFYFLVLLSNAMFFVMPAFWASGKLYPLTFLKAQDHGERFKPGQVRLGKFFERFFDFFPWPSRSAMAFLEKDLKTFSRDAAEWSQLIIFFGLLFFYFVNLRNLQFHVLKSFWRHLVFALNTIGTYVVLSSFSMRVIFPMLSLEGNKSWVLGSAPIRFSSLLLEKFFLGMSASVVLTLPLVFLSGKMLHIEATQIYLTIGLGFFVCVALSGLSVGLGAKFINFKSNNPTEIISGFGGSMLLISHLCYLTTVGVFLALSKETHMVTFAIMSFASLLVGVLPLWVGKKSMQQMEF